MRKHCHVTVHNHGAVIMVVDVCSVLVVYVVHSHVCPLMMMHCEVANSACHHHIVYVQRHTDNVLA